MHDTYGQPINTLTTEESVTYFYIFNNQLVTGVYNRRTTQTSYTFETLPRSLA